MTNHQDKLEWSRSVDASKLEQLKQMMEDPNYKENLPSLIRTIYQFAFQTYSDLPRGPIKNNSMKKLCASTLSEILPQEVAERINKMQRIHEEYGAIFDHLFKQHQKSSKQVLTAQVLDKMSHMYLLVIHHPPHSFLIYSNSKYY